MLGFGKKDEHEGTNKETGYWGQKRDTVVKGVKKFGGGVAALAVVGAGIYASGADEREEKKVEKEKDRVRHEEVLQSLPQPGPGEYIGVDWKIRKNITEEAQLERNRRESERSEAEYQQRLKKKRAEAGETAKRLMDEAQAEEDRLKAKRERNIAIRDRIEASVALKEKEDAERDKIEHLREQEQARQRDIQLREFDVAQRMATQAREDKEKALKAEQEARQTKAGKLLAKAKEKKKRLKPGHGLDPM